MEIAHLLYLWWLRTKGWAVIHFHTLTSPHSHNEYSSELSHTFSPTLPYQSTHTYAQTHTHTHTQTLHHAHTQVPQSCYWHSLHPQSLVRSPLRINNVNRMPHRAHTLLEWLLRQKPLSATSPCSRIACPVPGIFNVWTEPHVAVPCRKHNDKRSSSSREIYT